MLPPMIYRVFEPGLSGLENENAYLLMCKQTMPAGMLGLMLGGMIFATASSLNATLNISAGVFTNDIFKRLRPAAGETTLMKVARISTLGFGVLAIAVALLIPNMGGIVNVVISVAALTGVPLYLPLIWSLLLQEPERQGDPQHDRHQSDRQRRSQIHHACGRRLLAQPGRRDAGRGALPRAAAGRL